MNKTFREQDEFTYSVEGGGTCCVRADIRDDRCQWTPLAVSCYFVCTFNLVFYQQEIKIVGKPIIFLVLGLDVYLEKLIVVAYEKCVCPCVHRGVARG